MRLPLRESIGPLLAASLAAAPAVGDEIILKGGGRVSGRVVERTATRISIETGPGRVTLPMSRVEKIVEGRSAIEAFAERAEALAPSDVQGWAELARWAEERDLLTQARVAWQRVLDHDPGNAAANAGLGRVELDGAWMSRDEAYRAQGYVSFEGRWLTPAEHDAAVRERAAAEASAREARETDARVREAEARAREAEARAHEAEAAANQAAYGDGIPLGYVYGAGPVLYPGYPGYVPPVPGRKHLGRHGRSNRDHGDSNVKPTPRQGPPPRPSTTPQPRSDSGSRRQQAAIQPQSRRPAH
jgi:hypothetical protein